ncbi:MAG: N-acyl-D-amino-acid deacylase family protein [Promethearchaeota archaeon]
MFEFDVLIKGSKIVDGTGKLAYEGDIGLKGEKIVSVGKLSGDSKIEIEASGLIASPGFIDTHSHADSTILIYPLAENLIMQGVTMFLGGNCGSSPAPLNKYCSSRIVMANKWWDELGLNTPIPDYISLDNMDRYRDLINRETGFVVDWKTFDEFLGKVEKTGISINYTPLLGHATVRIAVLGDNWRREATKEEIEEMKPHVEEAMLSGSFGISSFFDPSPGEYSSINEILELVKIAQKHGGLYSPHHRHHQNNWYTEDPEEHGYGVTHTPPGEILVGRYHGLLEAIEIGRITKTPLLIAHLAPVYLTPQPTPEYLQEAAAKATIDIIDNAEREGINIFHNTIATSSSIGSEKPIVASFFNTRLSRPEWLRKMSREEFIEGLKKEDFRKRVKSYIYSGRLKFGMIHPLTDPYWTDCFKIIRCKKKEYVGLTIGEIARKRAPKHIIKAQYRESFETIFDILVEDPYTTWADILDKREYPGALRTFLKHSKGMPCIDCGVLPAIPPKNTNPSPFYYGLFPHYIDKFVKEERVLSLEEAVHHATYIPAQKVLGLKGRGIIKPDAYADIVLFNLDEISMAGNYLQPTKPPKGIYKVIVNGKIVYENMKHTGTKPGKVIRRQL